MLFYYRPSQPFDSGQRCRLTVRFWQDATEAEGPDSTLCSLSDYLAERPEYNVYRTSSSHRLCDEWCERHRVPIIFNGPSIQIAGYVCCSAAARPSSLSGFRTTRTSTLMHLPPSVVFSTSSNPRLGLFISDADAVHFPYRMAGLPPNLLRAVVATFGQHCCPIATARLLLMRGSV